MHKGWVKLQNFRLRTVLPLSQNQAAPSIESGCICKCASYRPLLKQRCLQNLTLQCVLILYSIKVI